MTTEINIDALIPAEMARRAEIIGVRKSELATITMFSLAVLAGAFIALGANFSTVVSTGAADLPYGVGRLLAGAVFCLGLILVVVGGAELFTGNNLIVMAWANRKVSTKSLLRNWLIVYVGNFVGAFGTALLAFLSKQYMFSGGGLGVTALRTAITKSSLDFIPAVALGILCNALVCLAVWMTFSARSTTDKIAAIFFPITAFVAAGFEHSIANMYFIPVGLLIKGFDPAFITSPAVVDAKLKLGALTWDAFLLNNLLPVTIGNIIGGCILVAAVYWSVYLWNKK